MRINIPSYLPDSESLPCDSFNEAISIVDHYLTIHDDATDCEDADYSLSPVASLIATDKAWYPDSCDVPKTYRTIAYYYKYRY